MIVVMTNGNAALQTAPGESSLGFTTPTMNLPKTMEGSFETAFIFTGALVSGCKSTPQLGHNSIDDVIAAMTFRWIICR